MLLRYAAQCLCGGLLLTVLADGQTRVPSVDAQEPIPLPMRNQPVPDRASLEDPTADYSTAAALAAKMPARKGKAPFRKLTLPDPYDHRRPARIAVPPESDQPVTASPRTPDK
jgi:hypothetical protein